VGPKLTKTGSWRRRENNYSVGKIRKQPLRNATKSKREEVFIILRFLTVWKKIVK